MAGELDSCICEDRGIHTMLSVRLGCGREAGDKRVDRGAKTYILPSTILGLMMTFIDIMYATYIIWTEEASSSFPFLHSDAAAQYFLITSSTTCTNNIKDTASSQTCHLLIKDYTEIQLLVSDTQYAGTY